METKAEFHAWWIRCHNMGAAPRGEALIEVASSEFHDLWGEFSQTEGETHIPIYNDAVIRFNKWIEDKKQCHD